MRAGTLRLFAGAFSTRCTQTACCQWLPPNKPDAYHLAQLLQGLAGHHWGLLLLQTLLQGQQLLPVLQQQLLLALSQVQLQLALLVIPLRVHEVLLALAGRLCLLQVAVAVLMKALLFSPGSASPHIHGGRHECQYRARCIWYLEVLQGPGTSTADGIDCHAGHTISKQLATGWSREIMPVPVWVPSSQDMPDAHNRRADLDYVTHSAAALKCKVQSESKDVAWGRDSRPWPSQRVLQFSNTCQPLMAELDHHINELFGILKVQPVVGLKSHLQAGCGRAPAMSRHAVDTAQALTVSH